MVSIASINLNDCKNPSLAFNKYIGYLGLLKYVELLKKIELSEEKKSAYISKIFTELFTEHHNKFIQKDSSLIKSIRIRRDRLIKQLRKNVIIHKEMKLLHRMLIGSGNPSFSEVGFTFSRNYGIPIIPSSALKGVFSHFVQEEIEKDNIIRKNFKDLFGTGTDNNHIKGNLLFLDAFPTSYTIGIDIVNNHFQPYYTGNKAPNDWYNPVPVQYLVVESGTFVFSLLAEEDIDENTKNEIKKAFLECASNFGIGSKTSYGYGLFKPVDWI